MTVTIRRSIRALLKGMKRGKSRDELLIWLTVKEGYERAMRALAKLREIPWIEEDTRLKLKLREQCS